MDLQFSSSRNGQQTCSADGRYIHSSFNPQNEALRFIQSLSCTFQPSAVVIAGACLPWCEQPLRERFPEARLIAVQYDVRFEAHSSAWDNVFFISDTAGAESFSNALFNLLGEENLITTQFISWKPSESIWPEENRLFWEAVKSCMEKAQSVLTTRDHFNHRWFRNSVSNLSSIRNYVIPQKTDLPVLVTASGPSLMRALPFIKANRSKYMLMAASSSISTLLANDIIPDCCISTDGGWYATRHLRAYQADPRLQDVPLIISAESAVPARIRNSVPFMLLSYGDGLETILTEQIGVPRQKGLRNGTVSGTAAALATTLTTGSVYMCGLDLAPGKGFQHAEPNENDVPLFTGQSRVRTIETSQAGSRFGSGSLALYRDWFSHQNEAFTSRVFRLVSESEPLEPLGTMKDICFEKLTVPDSKNTSVSPEANSFFKPVTVADDNSDKIAAYLSEVSSYIQKHADEEKCRLWYAELALRQYVAWLRKSKEEQVAELPSLAEATVSVIKEVLKHV